MCDCIYFTRTVALNIPSFQSSSDYWGGMFLPLTVPVLLWQLLPPTPSQDCFPCILFFGTLPILTLGGGESWCWDFCTFPNAHCDLTRYPSALFKSHPQHIEGYRIRAGKFKRKAVPSKAFLLSVYWYAGSALCSQSQCRVSST